MLLKILDIETILHSCNNMRGGIYGSLVLRNRGEIIFFSVSEGIFHFQMNRRKPFTTTHICISTIITCSAMILDDDWSIGVRSGAVHPLQIQYHTAESDNTTWSANLI